MFGLLIVVFSRLVYGVRVLVPSVRFLLCWLLLVGFRLFCVGVIVWCWLFVFCVWAFGVLYECCVIGVVCCVLVSMENSRRDQTSYTLNQRNDYTHIYM